MSIIQTMKKAVNQKKETMKGLIILLVLFTSCQKCKECTTTIVVKIKTGAFLEKSEAKELVCGMKEINYVDKTFTKENHGEYIIEKHVNCN